MISGLNQTCAEFDDQEALHYRGVLRMLVDLGSKMAADIAGEAATPPEPNTPKPDLTARFERISRTIRRCILLARKLAEPRPAPLANPAPLDRTAARKRIIREVGDAIDRGRRVDGVDFERLEAELLDRLDRPDIDDDLATRPIEHIIADLARDLGVGLPPNQPLRIWKRRTPEDIDALETHAAEPIPAEPRPPRTATRAPPTREIELPDDPAEAVAMVLALGKLRDG